MKTKIIIITLFIIFLSLLINHHCHSMTLNQWWNSQDRQDWNENYIYWQFFQHQILTNQFKISNKKAFLINVGTSALKEGCDQLCKLGYFDRNSTVFDKTKGADIKVDLKNTIVVSGASVCVNYFCKYLYNKFKKPEIKIRKLKPLYPKQHKKQNFNSGYDEFNRKWL